MPGPESPKEKSPMQSARGIDPDGLEKEIFSIPYYTIVYIK